MEPALQVETGGWILEMFLGQGFSTIYVSRLPLSLSVYTFPLLPTVFYIRYIHNETISNKISTSILIHIPLNSTQGSKQEREASHELEDRRCRLTPPPPNLAPIN